MLRTCVIAGLLLAAGLAGQDLSKVPDLSKVAAQGYLSDFAGVVDGGSREAINGYLAEVERATGAQVALVTVETLGGEPIEDVANRLYRRWGVGKRETNEGALFLFAIGDRKSRLEVGYGLEPIVPDGAAGSILRAMRPALRERQYGAAMVEAARQLGERIAAGKNVTLTTQLPVARADRRSGREPLEFSPWMILGGLVVLLILSSLGGRGGRRGYRGGGWYMPMGGGFGGGGGGGGGSSWGGFGGGDAGGGGASSDW